MQKYRRKSDTIEAVRFLGGKESADEILNWVLSLDDQTKPTITYSPAVEPWTSEDGDVGHNGVPEVITIRHMGGAASYVSVGDWLVKDRGMWYILPNEEIENNYVEVNDG